MNVPRIESVTPLQEKRLLVIFVNGIQKVYLLRQRQSAHRPQAGAAQDVIDGFELFLQQERGRRTDYGCRWRKSQPLAAPGPAR